MVSFMDGVQSETSYEEGNLVIQEMVNLVAVCCLCIRNVFGQFQVRFVWKEMIIYILFVFKTT